MAKVSYTQRIKLRIKEIEASLAELNAELVDLRTADRVLNKLGEDAQDEVAERSAHTTSTRTIADDVETVLLMLSKATTLEILANLTASYRPTLALTSLSSTLSRMRAANRVNQIDGKWEIHDATPDGPQDDKGQPVERSQDLLGT